MVISKATILFEKQILFELYEDLAFGKILNFFGIFPFHWNAIDLNILKTVD
jgi:hypothetical protein